jgi:predicted transcriptional regulator
MATTTSLKLPDELKDKIAAMAEGVAQTPHAYMVEAIAERVARDEKRRAFLDDANRSLRNFKRTGIAYTFADVEKYILEKAEGKNPRKPKAIKVPRARR